MRIEVYGGWKIFLGKKFTIFVRKKWSHAKIQEKLDTIMRKTNYGTPVFLRELRSGGFLYDYIDGDTVKRAIFDGELNKLDEKILPLHPETSNFRDEAEFFAMASISEEAYRKYYLTKYFNRPAHSEHLNPFAAKIIDPVEGLIMHHSYTEPFIEYVVKLGRHIIVTDKPLKDVKLPDEEPPKPFSLHIIDEKDYKKTMLFAHVDGVEIMYPPSVQRPAGTLKVPTITEGMPRLIPVPASDPAKIVERIEKIAPNPKKIYIHDNSTTVITPEKVYHITHTVPPRVKTRPLDG